jgi:hypothetical protein
MHADAHCLILEILHLRVTLCEFEMHGRDMVGAFERAFEKAGLESLAIAPLRTMIRQLVQGVELWAAALSRKARFLCCSKSIALGNPLNAGFAFLYAEIETGSTTWKGA